MKCCEVGEPCGISVFGERKAELVPSVTFSVAARAAAMFSSVVELLWPIDTLDRLDADDRTEMASKAASSTAARAFTARASASAISAAI